MKTVFSFLEDGSTKYCFILMNGEKISGLVSQVFDNGIEVNGTYRFAEAMIVYWYEIE